MKGGMTIPNIATFDHGTHLEFFVFPRKIANSPIMSLVKPGGYDVTKTSLGCFC